VRIQDRDDQPAPEVLLTSLAIGPGWEAAYGLFRPQRCLNLYLKLSGAEGLKTFSTVLIGTFVDNIGQEMHDFCRALFPLCRSITGDGFRQSLLAVKKILPGLTIFEVPTGTSCFDWVVPKEWNIHDAYIVTPGGNKICNFKKNNLPDVHREKILEIIRNRVDYKSNVDYVYIHPRPQNYEMFFADHFSLNRDILEKIVRIGFKSAIAALRTHNI
jgi:hypothetical protein